uniref:Uncharacterized protein n=1 Tax=Panagrolaimus davidi TaxID=227884 RepID=A0A914PQS3_9BILA
MVLNGNIFTELGEYFTFFLLFIVYEEKFSPIIVLIDYSKRTKNPLKFGEDLKSAILIFGVVGITVAISAAVSYSAIKFEKDAGIILIFALIFAAFMQIIGVFLTIHFYLKSKKMRFLSIDKCSLEEKHAYPKIGTRRNTKVGVVKTMLSAVPARGNIDEHFKTLNIMWK